MSLFGGGKERPQTWEQRHTPKRARTLPGKDADSAAEQALSVRQVHLKDFKESHIRMNPEAVAMYQDIYGTFYYYEDFPAERMTPTTPLLRAVESVNEKIQQQIALAASAEGSLSPTESQKQLAVADYSRATMYQNELIDFHSAESLYR